MTERPRKPVESSFDRSLASEKRDAGSGRLAVGAASSVLKGSTSLQMSADSANQWLREALGLAGEDTPFPWQVELFTRFANGTIDRPLDIPTGLGKTAVMAIWLVARACGAKLPRRLVYVVDRRAVVDHATEVAKGLRDFVDRNSEIKEKLGLGPRSLPISTLRGQYVDNKEWLEDPASPAIIVGTVDMIGSRLLFEGYGTSRKMRPYHAGLPGADTLVVLDEAHLVPPFEKLLEAIADGGAMFGPRDEALRQLVPPFKLLSLSATGRASAGNSFGLQDADLEHPVVKRRLYATKRLTVQPVTGGATLADELAKQAWKLADEGKQPVRCIVFCDKRKDAVDTLAAIEKLAKGDKKAGKPVVETDSELYVGGRRVFERERVAEWLKKQGFIAGANVVRTQPAFITPDSSAHFLSTRQRGASCALPCGGCNERWAGRERSRCVTDFDTWFSRLAGTVDLAGEDRDRRRLESAARPRLYLREER